MGIFPQAVSVRVHGSNEKDFNKASVQLPRQPLDHPFMKMTRKAVRKTKGDFKILEPDTRFYYAPGTLEVEMMVLMQEVNTRPPLKYAGVPAVGGYVQINRRYTRWKINPRDSQTKRKLGENAVKLKGLLQHLYSEIK
jgi:hypothetical protein